MFAMYKAEMCCQVLVGVFDNSVSTTDDYAELEPLCVILPDDEQPSPVNPPQATEPKKHNAQAPESTQNMPEPIEAAAKEPPHPTEAGTKEPNVETIREPNMFDNEEEYVGVDDEHIYISCTANHKCHCNTTS